MKKTDLAMIILIAAVSVLASYFITRAILGDNASEPVKVDMIDSIDTTVAPVDTDIFNKDAINPAVEIQITPGSE